MISHNRQVGKYTITRLIAKGGMGKIYQAKHPTLNRDIILKKLTLAGNRAVTERFKREAELMIDFREDRIVQVYDHFREGHSYYIAMEYVDGISLAALIERERYLPNEISLMIFLEICRALKYAHDKGVIHRDIKPENILISKNGEVKLTDFGIATSKSFHSENLTKNLVLGTPSYMSPEQINNTSNVDKRADIYSLGVLLYKMVTGKCPYPGNMNPETVNRICRGIYRTPRKVNPKISQFIQRIIVRSMQNKASRRYRDLSEIISRIEAYLKYSSSPVIHDILKNYISHNSTSSSTKVSDSNLIKTRHTGKAVVAVVCVALILALGTGTALLWKRGYYHEIISTETHGSIVINIKSSKQAFNRTVVLIEKKNENIYTEAKQVSASYNNIDKIYTTGRIYLPKGEYRLRSTVNGSVQYNDFNISPISIQRKEKAVLRPENVEIIHNPVQPAPLRIYFKVYDSVNGTDLTENAAVYILTKKKKIIINNGKTGNTPLLSGEEHEFLIKHNGYAEKKVTYNTLPHEQEIHITARLDPVPGKLSISGNTSDISISLNNSSYYYHPVRREKVALGTIQNDTKELVLAPGSYFISAAWNNIQEIAEVEILPEKMSTLQVICNKKSGKISITEI